MQARAPHTLAWARSPPARTLEILFRDDSILIRSGLKKTPRSIGTRCFLFDPKKLSAREEQEKPTISGWCWLAVVLDTNMTEQPEGQPQPKPVLQHKYSMDATLKRSIPVVEAEVEVGANERARRGDGCAAAV